MACRSQASLTRRSAAPWLRRVCWLACLLLPWATVPAQVPLDADLARLDTHSAAYQRFRQFVDEAVAGNPGYGFSATDAAYMYRLTGHRAYGELAVAMVDRQVGDAEAAIAAGKTPAVADDSYLEIGPMLRDLALAYDWCGPLAGPARKARWKAYADQAVFNVWHQQLASWGGRWHPGNGWAVQDPGDNYYYSFLQATMYWALASDNARLLRFLARDRLPLLAGYFADLPGGGSREGTSYGASLRTLFDLYRLWRDATGQDLANANPHLTETIDYWIHATLPTLDRFAPIGDQPRVSVPELYDYERQLMLEARLLTADRAAAQRATWWLHRIALKQMSNDFNARYDLLEAGDGGTPPATLVYHASGAGQLFARTGWDKEAMWLDFTAGTYDQSHAHQAQGAFTLFAGDWLAVSENIWSHSGIHQDTPTNNVLRFEQDGRVLPQVAPSRSTLQLTATGPDGEVHARADLTPAYRGEPAVRAWQRSIDFAGRQLTVTDRFALAPSTAAVFQVNVPERPVISGRTVTAGSLRMVVREPADARVVAVEWSRIDPDYLRGWRIDVRGTGDRFVVTLGSSDDAPRRVAGR